MKILFLGPESDVFHFLKTYGEVTRTEEPINAGFAEGHDWLVSYGYRYIIQPDVLELFKPGRAVNLHISYLPWNRGADPNLWSWIDDTPKGVSIHQLDSGIDTGPLLHRRLVAFDIAKETLASSYHKLQSEIVALFKEAWPKAHARGKFLPCVQPKEAGSYHETADREKVAHLLTKGWNTPVSELRPQ